MRYHIRKMPENKWWIWFGKALVAAVSAIWIGMDSASRALIFLMGADYATGLIAAYIAKDLHSREAFTGLLRKIMTLLLVVGIYLAGKLEGLPDFGGPAFACWFCASELISIAENCGRAGIRLPGPVVSVIRTLREKDQSLGKPAGQPKTDPRIDL